MTVKVAISEADTSGGKLPMGDPRWATFNDSFQNDELDTIDFLGHIYAGHHYTTWHNGRRKLDNFMLAQHVALDFDTEDERSTIDYLRQVQLVKMYAAFMHTTPSHTPQTPRCRVVFLLDEPITDAKAYTEAVRVLVSQIPHADEACTDASRFFYGARGCDTWLHEDIGNELPLSHLRRLWQLYAAKFTPQQRATKANVINLVERRAAQQIQHGKVDDLEKATEALKKIDPWSMSYSKWIGVIAAMKRDLGDAALPAVISWADGKPGEVEREWERLKMDRSNGAGLGTVFYMAKAGG